MTETVPTLFYQGLAVTNAFVVKPIYMLLSFALLLRLRRETRPPIPMLWWGLLFFLLGEGACALNYCVFGLSSVFWEMAHDGGMLIAFALIGYAAMDFVDSHVLRVSVPAKACALLPFCKACPKQGTLPECNLRFLYRLAVAAWMLVAVYPLSKPLLDRPVLFRIFDGTYLSHHLPIYQVFESRFCPIMGLCCLLVTMALLLRRTDRAFHLSRATFAAGIAFVAFGFVRTGIFHGNLDNLILFDFWEEWTELAFVLALIALLWRFPRQILGEKPAMKETPLES